MDTIQLQEPIIDTFISLNSRRKCRSGRTITWEALRWRCTQSSCLIHSTASLSQRLQSKSKNKQTEKYLEIIMDVMQYVAKWKYAKYDVWICCTDSDLGRVSVDCMKTNSVLCHSLLGYSHFSLYYHIPGWNQISFQLTWTISI